MSRKTQKWLGVSIIGLFLALTLTAAAMLAQGWEPQPPAGWPNQVSLFDDNLYVGVTPPTPN